MYGIIAVNKVGALSEHCSGVDVRGILEFTCKGLAWRIVLSISSVSVADG